MEGSVNPIERIDKKTADLICSGQVATSLAIVAKELLENALDANAKHIEIKLKEYGKESIQVNDNGDGVLECNFEMLTGKHNTSKLSEIDDLTKIVSFGFRGEALSSICALSKLIIRTRHKDDEFGTELHFDSDGQIIKRELIARQVGTSVIVTDLFHCLPVRRKEFINNYMREFNKLIKVITSYCLGCIGVRIVCTNSYGANKQTFLSSFGLTLKGNITDVFGNKQLDSLIEFKQIDNEKFGINNDDLVIKGFISKCDSSFGRSKSDRQYFFLNNRPCEMKKLSRFINEIYHNFNRNQYPFVLFDIKINRNYVDINVTPDKREVLIANDEKIYEIIKESLNEMYNKSDGCNVVSLSSSRLMQKWKSQLAEKRTAQQIDHSSEDEDFLQQLKIKRCRSPCDSPFKEVSKETAHTSNQVVIVPFQLEKNNHSNHSKNRNEIHETTSKSINETTSNSINETTSNSINETTPNSTNETTSNSINETTICDTRKSLVNNLDTSSFVSSFNLSIIDTPSKNKILKTKIAEIDLNTIKADFMKIHKKTLNSQCTKFTAQLTPSDNEKAEEELDKELKRHMFKDMKIIGQFNLGFIITKINFDLFIIDQHATNERYNYENLQQNTVINTQQLVNPYDLEFTSITELIIKDNLSVFKQHGFTFSYDENAAPGKRFRLLTVPYTKDWFGGKDDVEELINIICETPIKLSNDYKLKSLKKLFASRACRSSIMIGKKLSFVMMKEVVAQMSDLKNPWHCAHHRPTIRHLINMKTM